MSELLELLHTKLRTGHEAPAQRFVAGGQWRTRSYAELCALVDRVAALLHARWGIVRRDRVAILMPTRADWTVVDLALASLGATIVPIYPTASAEQIADLIHRSGTRLVITVPDRDLGAIADGTVGVARVGATDGDLGELDGEAPSESTLSTNAASDDDLFTIGYSSGTTGLPKGCLLTHANYAAVINASCEFEFADAPAPGHRAAVFIYLPLAHASARLHELVTLSVGGELVYGAGSTAEILDQIADTAPTYVAGVPRLFESAWMRSRSQESRSLARIFGGNLWYAMTGGAPISAELLAAYREAGIELMEGYGLTETATALAVSAPHDHRDGSVGRALPGVDLRIGADGEILARGDNLCQGYLDDPDSTAQAFIDGWFHTGDAGRIDADGYLYITGRLKNLIVTSTGKNIAPEPVENEIRLRCQVDDVVMVGDRRPYLSVLVSAPMHRLPDIAEELRVMNAAYAPPERVRKLVLLDVPFTQVAGLVTASGKTARAAVSEHWSDLLDVIYSDGPDPDNVVDIDRPARLQATG